MPNKHSIEKNNNNKPLNSILEKSENEFLKIINNSNISIEEKMHSAEKTFFLLQQKIENYQKSNTVEEANKKEIIEAKQRTIPFLIFSFGSKKICSKNDKKLLLNTLNPNLSEKELTSEGDLKNKENKKDLMNSFFNIVSNRGQWLLETNGGFLPIMKSAIFLFEEKQINILIGKKRLELKDKQKKLEISKRELLQKKKEKKTDEIEILSSRCNNYEASIKKDRELLDSFKLLTTDDLEKFILFLNQESKKEMGGNHLQQKFSKRATPITDFFKIKDRNDTREKPAKTLKNLMEETYRNTYQLKVTKEKLPILEQIVKEK